MAVCAGSSGNGLTSLEENTYSLNLTGALTPGLAPYNPFQTVGGYAAPVWVANQERPIRHADQASLIVQLVADSTGSTVLELQLRDGETVVWRVSNVHSMEMQEDTGQLVLYNSSNLPVWQSSLADTLVSGQKLTDEEGKDQLVSNDSSYVARMEKGALVFYMNKPHFNSMVEGQGQGQRPPAPYWVFPVSPLISSSADDPCSNSSAHAETDDYGGIDLYCSNYPSLLIRSTAGITVNNSWSFWRLESDGMLYVYFVVNSAGDASPVSVTRGSLDTFYYNGTGIDSHALDWEDCNLPMACGPLGVCTPGAQTLCSCSSLGPDFEPKNETSLFQGCKRTLDLPNCTTFGKGHNSTSSTSTDFVQLNSTASIFLFNAWTLNSSRTPGAVDQLSACKQSCSSDCSCTGFFYQMNTSSCFFITDGITLLAVVDKNYTSLQDTTKFSTVFAKNYVTFLKVPSAANKTSSSSRAALKIALSVIIPSALVCLVLGMVFRARRNKNEQYTKRLSKEESKELQDILPLLPSRYSYQDLFRATEGFSKLLGAGGCGSVYAGVLSDGRKVAVKVLQAVLQGTGHSKQFLAEIATIGRTGHHNIVRLVGFCWEVSQRLLVYEYVERGSLDRWIFVRELAPLVDDITSEAVEPPFLDWKTRYNVALGIVRGLTYLHEECEPPILHFDIKPQNILLDNDFVAKLADFGMSRLIERDVSAVVTGMRGTPGYIAPEWCSHGKVGKKSDVFSMGMVLLEIVGGRKNLDFSLLNSSSDPDEQQAWHFPSWAAQKCEQGQMMELVDRRLHGCGFDVAQALKLISIAFWCIQEDPAARPNVSMIVQWLEGSSIVEKPPFSMALNVGRRPVD